MFIDALTRIVKFLRLFFDDSDLISDLELGGLTVLTTCSLSALLQYVICVKRGEMKHMYWRSNLACNLFAILYIWTCLIFKIIYDGKYYCHVNIIMSHMIFPIYLGSSLSRVVGMYIIEKKLIRSPGDTGHRVHTYKRNDVFARVFSFALLTHVLFSAMGAFVCILLFTEGDKTLPHRCMEDAYFAYSYAIGGIIYAALIKYFSTVVRSVECNDAKEEITSLLTIWTGILFLFGAFGIARETMEMMDMRTLEPYNYFLLLIFSSGFAVTVVRPVLVHRIIDERRLRLSSMSRDCSHPALIGAGREQYIPPSSMMEFMRMSTESERTILRRYIAQNHRVASEYVSFLEICAVYEKSSTDSRENMFESIVGRHLTLSEEQKKSHDLVDACIEWYQIDTVASFMYLAHSVEYSHIHGFIGNDQDTKDKCIKGASEIVTRILDKERSGSTKETPVFTLFKTETTINDVIIERISIDLCHRVHQHNIHNEP